MTTRGERLQSYLMARTGGRRGWQAKLVADSGVKRQTITKWTRLAFDGYPDPEALGAVAVALGVKPWEIVRAIDGDDADGRDLETRLARLEAMVDGLVQAGPGRRGTRVSGRPLSPDQKAG